MSEGTTTVLIWCCRFKSLSDTLEGLAASGEKSKELSKIHAGDAKRRRYRAQAETGDAIADKPIAAARADECARNPWDGH